jgi:predicted adenine nucleotide alpha hydrolase (AANH) superfamily ATPase
VALERLCWEYDATLFYYNPNTLPEAEWALRLENVKKLGAKLITAPRREGDFLEIARGLEAEPEGGARCESCIALRLGETAREASERGFTHICTTLTTGPRKNAVLINSLGEKAAARYGLSWLSEDFKKRDGCRRSVELSKQYGLYRQSYCGCTPRGPFTENS